MPSFDLIDQQRDAAAIIATVRELSTVGFGNLDGRTGDGVPPQYAAVPRGIELKSLRSIADEWLERPRRRRGTMTARDVESFCAMVNRFKADDTTAIFGSDAADKLSLTAVFDWHPGNGAIDDARFGHHRCRYDFPFSREWQEWAAIRGKSLAQAELAAFLERRIEDVRPEPLSIDGNGERVTEIADPEIRKLVVTLGKRVASPAELVSMSRTFQVNATGEAKTAVNPDTGEVTLSFEETHTQARAPSLFLIAIPVLHMGPLVLVAVHLRYRRAGGSITWQLELHQPERVIEATFAAALARVQEATGLAPLRGAPEGSGSAGA